MHADGGGVESKVSMSLSSKSRLNSRLNVSGSIIRRVSGVPTKLPSLLLAKAKVLALALLSDAELFKRSRRAAEAPVAAGVAAAGMAAAGEAAARMAAAGMAAAGEAAACVFAAVVAAAPVVAARAVGVVAAAGVAAAGDDTGLAAAGNAAAAEPGVAFLFSFHNVRLILIFSLLFSLGGRFLERF